MNQAVKTIAVSLITAGILANFAVLWQFNSRLASIETTLKYFTENKTNLATK